MGKIIQYNGLFLNYEMFGQGKETLITFHGIGRDHSDFEVFTGSLGQHFTIISIDLFGHGKSVISSERIKNRPVTKEELYIIIDQLLKQLNIERFSLMGFSLGGKVALCCLEKYYKSVDSITLLAADGVKINIWYDLVTQTWLGRKIYKTIIPGAGTFLWIVDLLSSIGFVHKKLRDFVRNQLSTKEKRQFIFDTWMIYRKLQPNTPQIIEAVNKENIRTNLIFGKYDRIIKAKIALKFANRLSQKDSLHLLEAGHGLLSDKTDQYLKAHFDQLFINKKGVS